MIKIIDESVLHFFNGLSTPEWLDTLMIAFTRLGDYGFIWILSAVILLCFKPKRRSGFAMALALVFCIILINMIIKNAVARPRPYDVYNGIKLIVAAPDSWSFPSGHTGSSIACALVLFYYERKLFPAGLIVALLISVSRLYLCLHYVSDVAGGLLIGVLCAVLAIIISRRVKRIRGFELG